MEKDPMKRVTEPIEKAPPEIRRIIEKVLQLEYSKQSVSRPHITDDVVTIIKEEIRL